MARYRLRFLLHEMDLPEGELLIGRSASCNLTMDDPLVSRSHARIVVSSENATIEDAGSRNGIRVDGRTISGPAELHDGSRFRIGTQELIIRRLQNVTAQPPRRKVTGFMVHCTQCGLPRSATDPKCPGCGKSEKQENEEVGEELTTTTEQAWSIELLAETIHRARALGRSDNLERLLIQARGVLETTTVTIDRRRLDQLADGAIRLAEEKGNVDWAKWALRLYSKRRMAPGPDVGAQIGSLPPETRETLAPALGAVVRSLNPLSTHGESADEATILLLRQLAGESEAG